MADVVAPTDATVDEPPACALRVIAPVVAQPMQVSILSCCHETADLAHACHIQDAGTQCCQVRPIDCGRWFEEITSTVDEKCGKSHVMHRTIIGSPFFVSAMTTCVDHSVKNPGLQILVHPTYVSYVLASIEADALNELRTPDGRRIFNARVYCLHEKTATECRKTIEEALSWLDDDAWSLEGPSHDYDRFGYAALLIDNKFKAHHPRNVGALIALGKWEEWLAVLTTYEITITGISKTVVDNKTFEKIMAVHVTGPSSSDDDAPSVNDDQDEESPVAELLATRSCASADVRQTAGYVTPQPWPPRNAEPSSMQQWHSGDRQKPSWGTWQQGGTHSSWWSQSPACNDHRQSWARGGDWSSSCHQPDSQSYKTRPSYVVAQNYNDRSSTIGSWFDTLIEEFGVDTMARKEMVLLAQHSEKGYQAVNSLISKLYLKKRKGEWIANTSAFISNGIRNAREEIDSR